MAKSSKKNTFKAVPQKKGSVKQTDDSTMRLVMGFILVAIIVIVVAVVYSNKNAQQPSSTGQQQQQQQQQQNIPQLQQRVADAEKAAKANPKDLGQQKVLGDAYYDLGYGYLTQNNQTQYTQYFGKAVECYQKVLAANFDINTQTDMSTAAFYAGKFDIADKGFKTAIQKQPNFAQARFNYGIFLRDAKNDKAGAKAQFEALAKLVKTPDQIKQVQDLLATVQ